MSAQHHSFEVLFRRFQPVLVQYACTILRSEEEARGIVQEVFLNVWRKKEQLNFDDNLKPYLFRAVRNHSLNRVQRNKIDANPLDENLPAPADPAHDDEAERASKIQQIHRQVSLLPDQCREIFMMSRLEGLSHAEIAQILDLSTKTIENQIGIALRKIRQGIAKKI